MASESENILGPVTEATTSTSLTTSDEIPTPHSTGDPLLPRPEQAVDHMKDYGMTNTVSSTTSAEQAFNGPNKQNDIKDPEKAVGNTEFLDTIGGSAGINALGTHDGAFGTTDDEASLDTTWSESTTVPRRNLGFVQITSLMLNASIGSSVFVTPGYVLALTRSKTISLVLWATGGVYSALGMLLFLEYGTALPFNGGALIYLDEVFHRPRLLATVVFSVYWILLASTITDTRNVALSILSVANPGTPSSELPDGQIRLTAVVVQTFSCLMLFFARRLCFVFNSTFALYKIILLLFIFVAGMVYNHGRNSGLKDFNTEYPGYSGGDALTAMIYIIYSYQGWDNVNYITGEVKDCKRTLKWAGCCSILILTCLYMLTTFTFYAVSDYATLTNDAGRDNSALQFAETVFGSSTGMAVAVGLCIFSCQLFTTYTTTKGTVKQAIAWQRIIPFYKFFGRQDPYFDSPGGALFLHWLFTAIPIASMDTRSSVRSFYTGIYSYGYQIMCVFLAVGLLRLKLRMRLVKPNWQPTYMKSNALIYFVSFVFAAINLVTLVMTALPASEGSIPHFWWPVTVAGVIGLGIAYWGFLRLLQVKEGYKTNGQGEHARRRWTLREQIGLEVNVYEEGDENVPEEMQFLMYEAIGDGSRRRIQYKVSGPISQCRNWYRKGEHFVCKFLGY